jgi:hypothetical protein
VAEEEREDEEVEPFEFDKPGDTAADIPDDN